MSSTCRLGRISCCCLVHHALCELSVVLGTIGNRHLETGAVLGRLGIRSLDGGLDIFDHLCILLLDRVRHPIRVSGIYPRLGTLLGTGLFCGLEAPPAQLLDHVWPRLDLTLPQRRIPPAHILAVDDERREAVSRLVPGIHAFVDSGQMGKGSVVRSPAEGNARGCKDHQVVRVRTRVLLGRAAELSGRLHEVFEALCFPLLDPLRARPL